MKDEHFIDPQGREIPKMIGIRKKEQKSLWVDTLETVPEKIRVALS